MGRAKELHEKWLSIKAGITSKDWDIIKEHLKKSGISLIDGFGTIVEVSFKSLLKKILSKSMGVISGFSVLDTDITQSVKNTKKLKKELEAKGYKVVYIGGAWKDTELGGVIPELSLLVIADNPKDLLNTLSKLAKKYNQFAFIFGDGEDIVLYERGSLDKNFFTPTKKLTGYTTMNLKKAIELMHQAQIEGISFYRSKAILGQTEEPLPSDWTRLFKKYGIKGIRRERIERAIRMDFLKDGRAEYKLISPFVVEPRGWVSELGAKSDRSIRLRELYAL